MALDKSSNCVTASYRFWTETMTSRTQKGGWNALKAVIPIHDKHRVFTSKLLLPVHLVKEVFCSQEEVIDLAALLVSLCGVVDAQLGFGGQELADVWHGEHNLLHGSVLTHNLNNEAHPTFSTGRIAFFFPTSLMGFYFNFTT